MKKNYVIDTNILIEDAKCIEKLRNGEENHIFIPETVIDELDNLKDKKPQLKKNIFSVLEEMTTYKDDIVILKIKDNKKSFSNKDNKILEEIKSNIFDVPPIFVTNDKILRFKSYKIGIQTEEYKNYIPNKEISEQYTGFIDYENDEKIENCFYWKNGKIYFYSNNSEKCVSYDNIIWKIKPWNYQQNCFFELILNENVDLITVQSDPGRGKTLLALASSFHLAFQKNTTENNYEKIYIVKSNYEIGNSLGFLPGTIDEKMEPYFKPVSQLIKKLVKKRPIPKKFLSGDTTSDFIEFIPINYLRGMNLENCIVILDETQNLSRSEARSFLSRMGQNVKCICTGSIQQIDNPFLDKNNNAMNWIVELFKGEPNYGHIVLNGKHTRGPICDLVNRKKL